MKHSKYNRLDHYLPTPGTSWLIVALLISGMVIFGLMLGFVIRIHPSPLLKSTSLSYLFTMILPLIFIWKSAGMARKSGSAPVSINEPDFGKLGAPLCFLLITAVLVSLYTLIEPLTSLIPMPERVKMAFREAFVNTTLADSIIGTSILAPLFEEFLCRGIMMRGMLQTLSPKGAITMSAFIFAFIHMNPWQAIPAFIFGLFFGWVYWKTRCIWATVFLHCFNNSLSTLLTRLLPDMDVDEGFIDILPTDKYIILYFCSAVIFTIAFLLLKKYLPKHNKNDQETIPA